MSITILSAAKWLANRSDWRLSNLELQKILYIAHMFYLGRTGSDALVNGNFEAWDYGPVHPSLYHQLKVFGSDPVKNIFHSVADLDKGGKADILNEVFVSLGDVGPGKLVHITHRPGGAWDINYSLARHCIISNTDILKEYKGLQNSDG